MKIDTWTNEATTKAKWTISTLAKSILERRLFTRLKAFFSHQSDLRISHVDHTGWIFSWSIEGGDCLHGRHDKHIFVSYLILLNHKLHDEIDAHERLGGGALKFLMKNLMKDNPWIQFQFFLSKVHSISWTLNEDFELHLQDNDKIMHRENILLLSQFFMLQWFVCKNNVCALNFKISC